MQQQRTNHIPQQLQGQEFSHFYLKQKHGGQHTLVQSHPCLTFSLFCTMGNHQPEPAATKPKKSINLTHTDICRAVEQNPNARHSFINFLQTVQYKYFPKPSSKLNHKTSSHGGKVGMDNSSETMLHYFTFQKIANSYKSHLHPKCIIKLLVANSVQHHAISDPTNILTLMLFGEWLRRQVQNTQIQH